MVARPTQRGAPLAHQHAPANAHEYARHAEHKHAHTHTHRRACARRRKHTFRHSHRSVRTSTQASCYSLQPHCTSVEHDGGASVLCSLSTEAGPLVSDHNEFIHCLFAWRFLNRRRYHPLILIYPLSSIYWAHAAAGILPPLEFTVLWVLGCDSESGSHFPIQTHLSPRE